MLSVHDQAGKLVAISLQSKQYTQAHIVDAALHGAVHRFGMPIIITLRTCGMQLLVTLFVIRFLEQNVCANLCFFKHAVLFDRGRGNVHVNASDCAIAVFDGIDGFHALQDVFDGVVLRIFACFDGQALMTHILQGNNLSANLFLSELPAGDGAILCVIRAIQAAFHAVVRKIQRRKKNNTITVVGQLNLVRQFFDFPIDLRIFAGQKNACLTMGYNRTMIGRRMQVGTCLVQNAAAQLDIVFMRISVGDGIEDLRVVDELVGAKRFRIVAEFRH